MSKLDQSIIATIAYFDVFEYPLTSIEVWKWLHHERVEDTAMPATPLGEVLEALKESPGLREKIEYKDGFYFLHNREHCILTRSKRYRIAERKWARAMRFVRLARITPFVRMIAVCNSLSYSNARRSSDIDFFIMTARERIWTVRLLMVWIIKLLRLRPRRGHVQDTFCLSFFVSEQHLDLSDITLHEAGNPARCQISDDVYFTYWLSQLAPVFDESSYYVQLWHANGWIRQYLPNIFPRKLHTRRSVAPRFWASFATASVEWLLGGPVGDMVERGARAFQLAILPAVLKRMSGEEDSRVVINDHMLKMHQNDRRILYWHMWQERLHDTAGER